MNAHKCDAGRALERALRLKLRPYVVTFTTLRSLPWASVTFSGARHELEFRIAGEGASAAADRFLADLDCAEFQLPAHILADIALVARADTEEWVEIRLEALTVEDG